MTKQKEHNEVCVRESRDWNNSGNKRKGKKVNGAMASVESGIEIQLQAAATPLVLASQPDVPMAPASVPRRPGRRSSLSAQPN